MFAVVTIYYFRDKIIKNYKKKKNTKRRRIGITDVCLALTRDVENFFTLENDDLYEKMCVFFFLHFAFYIFDVKTKNFTDFHTTLRDKPT